MSQEETHVEEVKSRKFSLDRFVEENQRNLMIAGAVLILLAGGFWFYKAKFQPKREAKANDALFMAERYFGQDSLDLAMNGDGNYSGLIDVIDEFPRTKAGQRASYYAGIISMKKAKYDEALDYLKKVKFDDEIVGPLSTVLIGDCYVELDQVEDAAKQYMKAAKMKKNDFTAPYAYQKAYRAYSSLGQHDKALAALKVIQKDYSKTRFAENIDKYIAKEETAAEHN